MKNKSSGARAVSFLRRPRSLGRNYPNYTVGKWTNLSCPLYGNFHDIKGYYEKVLLQAHLRRRDLVSLLPAQTCNNHYRVKSL